MKKFFFVILLILTLNLNSFAQSRAQGIVSKGGKTLRTSSTTYKLMETFPSATVTVYLAGTATLATIYSTITLTPKSNPFVADSEGNWFFYAANGRYDVRFSGTGITTPFTLFDVILYDLSGGGGGGGGISTLNSQSQGSQIFTTNTNGTDFNISSSAGTHTFNMPSAGAGITRGLITNGVQTIEGAKTFSSTINGNISGNAATSTTTSGFTGVLPIANGGTGITTIPTANKVLTVNPAGTNYEGATLTAGSNIVITRTLNGFQFDATGTLSTDAASLRTYNVALTAPLNNQYLVYNTTSSSWQPQFLTSSNINTALGYTPANKGGEAFTGAVSATSLSSATGSIGNLTTNTLTFGTGSSQYNVMRSEEFIEFFNFKSPITVGTTLATLYADTITTPAGGYSPPLEVFFNNAELTGIAFSIEATFGYITGTTDCSVSLRNDTDGVAFGESLNKVFNVSYGNKVARSVPFVASGTGVKRLIVQAQANVTGGCSISKVRLVANPSFHSCGSNGRPACY